jgi:hypothetical protein
VKSIGSLLKVYKSNISSPRTFSVTLVHRFLRQECSFYSVIDKMGFQNPISAMNELPRVCFMEDIKRNNDDRKNPKNVLDNFILIDEPINLSLQEEYLRFSERIDFDNVDYKELLPGSDKRFL